ncbi:bifunctional demethylmenaquinone methyltransferase/2-methoxy-6-polyprenyl-1,4-benzoquinol methylase UbiE [bacterium]|nr:bifunctional demethylmenaquinone methyltransferase/2-methoxy-6-polyprenyl-1,4-benzoquinol methylase UbiE [bacterium]
MTQTPTDNQITKPDTSQFNRKIRDMFDLITPRYDLLNRVLSARQDVYWRRRTVKLLPDKCERVLDSATGSGDLAIEIARKYPDAQVIGLDFVYRMLELAGKKTLEANAENQIHYISGDANCLPFEDHTFDAVTIAFGLRNIQDRLAAVNEMKRVVRPGGKVLVLEMTFPQNIGMRWFFRFYLNFVIPTLGRLISKGGAYRYLSDSIQGFLSPDEMKALFSEAGLINIKAHRLTGGICYIHEGTVG